MRSLVVYKSISGFTKKYAEWISEELGSDCISISEINNVKLSDYDFVVFGGSLHAIGINGFKQFRKYIPKIGNDKILIFGVGASPYKNGIEEELKLKNLNEDMEKAIPLFYLRGGFDYSKLDLYNKILMKLLEVKIKFKKIKNSDEMGMLKAYKYPLDTTKKENIEPIIECIKKII